MNSAGCSLNLRATHNCPSRFISAGRGSVIPMHRWVSRQVSSCRDAEPCLRHLQHVIAGKLLYGFQCEIKEFSDTCSTLATHIQLPQCPTESPSAIAYQAIMDETKAIANAHIRGYQVHAVRLAEAFIQTLPERLKTIQGEERPNTSVTKHSDCFGVKQQLQTLQIWQKALEALSTENRPTTLDNEVQALLTHNQQTHLKLPQLFEFWGDVSSRLLKVYSCPYSDYSTTISVIKTYIDRFCEKSGLLSKENFTELKASLDTWEAERMTRFQNDRFTNTLAAAYFYSAQLSDFNGQGDIMYFGLFFGLNFTELEEISTSSKSKAKTVVLHRILQQRGSVDGRLNLNSLEKEIIETLCRCEHYALASKLANDWTIPYPGKLPDKTIDHFRALKPSDTVPLVLAFKLLHIVPCCYNLGIALGLTIPDIDHMTDNHCTTSVLTLRLLNKMQPLTRQYLENCMTHPAVNIPGGPMEKALLTIDPLRKWQWQPFAISEENRNPTSKLDKQHICIMAPVTDWFSFGYASGLSTGTLFDHKEDYERFGQYAGFYPMLNHLQESTETTIGQLVSIAQREGFADTLKYLPETCKPRSFMAIPAITYPDPHHRLTISLLKDHAEQWLEVGNHFNLHKTVLSDIKKRTQWTDKEKLIRVLDLVYRRNEQPVLQKEYDNLIRSLQSR